MTNPFHAVVADEFEAVNHLIVDSLHSRVPLVEEVSSYLIEAGGKRLRPLLVLMAARACNYQGVQQIKLAAIIEFLHTAMLLHDDVVDASELRRGRKTVNATWGNPASVLVGDFLHSRAFEMMVEIGNLRVMEILSHATNVIAEGEVQQLANIRNPDITEEAYRQVITRKTAMLFQAASHSGAVLAGAPEVQEEALQHFGLHLGLAFQLIDDALDYDGDTENLGKNVGDDLAEGKVTLPLLHVIRDGKPADAAFVRQAILSGGVENLNQIVTTVRDNGSLEYTLNAARDEANKAGVCLQALPPSKVRSAMQSMLDFSVERSF